MNAFNDIDALLRVISREKDILRFLFVSRKAPSLRREQALENFLSQDTRRHRYMGEILRIIALSTHRNVIDLKRAIDSTYKKERDYAVKRKRLENLDRKRADIALLIKEAEKLFGVRQQVFFGPGMDAHLKETLAGVKDSLTESYHGLLDRQIIVYLNKIEAEQRLATSGSRDRYQVQFERFGKMDVPDVRLLPLVSLIHRHQKGYDQEGYIAGHENYE